MGILELIQQKSFLGKEFLTWLWYRAETQPDFELSGSRSCEAEILGPLLLDANYGDARSTALKGEAAALSAEAATALREGKKLKRAKFKFTCEGMDWIATLDGESFAMGGLAIPAAGKLPFEEALRLRLDFILDYETMLSELLQAFLELRLDEKLWSTELEKIQQWVGDK